MIEKSPTNQVSNTATLHDDEQTTPDSGIDGPPAAIPGDRCRSPRQDQEAQVPTKQPTKKVAIPQQPNHSLTSNAGSSHSTAPKAGNRLPPPQTRSDFVLLTMLSFLVIFGVHYLFQLPASVRQQLKQVMSTDNDGDDDSFEARYQLLFTVVTVTGIFLPLFAGPLVDQAGGSLCMTVTSMICWLGQVIAAAGVERKSWGMLLAGRFVYGLGVEGVCVSNEAFLASSVAKGKRLGLALGIFIMAAYVGYLLSISLSPLVANRVSLPFAFWLGALVQGVSVCAAVSLYMMDRKQKVHAIFNDTKSQEAVNDSGGGSEGGASVGQPQEKITKSRDGLDASSRSHSRTRNTEPDAGHSRHEEEGDGGHQTSVWNSCFRFNILFWLLCLSCLLVYSVTVSFTGIAQGVLLERDLFLEPPIDCLLEFPYQCSSGYLAPESGNPSLIKGTGGEVCPLRNNNAPVIPESLNVTQGDPLWDGADYTFPHLEAADIDCSDEFWSDACTADYCDKQDEATEKAGVLMSIPFMMTMTMVFVLGHFGVDRAGLRAEMLCLAPAILVAATALLAFSSCSPILPMILMGLGQSVEVSALWPSVPLLVPENAKGVAFGVFTSAQGIGLSLWPLMIAAIYMNTGKSYLPSVVVFLMLCSVLAVVVGFTLLCLDRRSGGKLRARDDRRSSKHNEEPFPEDIRG